MSYDHIAALLKEKIGLNAESIGIASIERAVTERLTARGLPDIGLYCDEIAASEQELQELIEAVVIPETWFFREAEAFAALVKEARDGWLTRHAEATLRILSVPCSTGEEPFSMAMALLDARFPPERFHIEAIDISTRALERAMHATYGKNSFRTKDLGYRDRHFLAVEGGYRLSEEVRRKVHFRHGNLLVPEWLHGVHGYHVIFSRNVLIYFDGDTQRRALDVLTRLLSPAGLLFVGPSEAGLLLDHGFISAGFPHAFAFRRPDATVPAPRSTRVPVPPATVRLSRLLNGPKPAPVAKPRAATLDVEPPIDPAKPRSDRPTGKQRPAESNPGAAGEHWLGTARRLADQGKIAEALEYCDEQLESRPACAETFYLMGLLHDAAGRIREASEHYRKALYLDPQHAEALVHLAVTLQKEGDMQGAQRLIQRANRQLKAGRAP